jgi:hypothetical protein
LTIKPIENNSEVLSSESIYINAFDRKSIGMDRFFIGLKTPEAKIPALLVDEPIGRK